MAVPPISETISPIRFVLDICRRHVPVTLLATIITILSASMATLSPMALKVVVDGVQAGNAAAAWQGLGMFAAVLVLILLLDGAAALAVAYASGKIGHAAYGVAFRRALLLPVHHHARQMSGATASQIAQVSAAAYELFGTSVGQMLRIAAAAIAATLVAASAGWLVALLMGFWIVALLALSVMLSRKAGHLAADLAKATAASSGHVSDVFANVASVVINGRRDDEGAAALRLADTQRKANLRRWIYGQKRLALGGLAQIGFLATTTAASLWAWSSGMASAGDVVMVVTLAVSVQRTLEWAGHQVNAATAQYGVLLHVLPAIFGTEAEEDGPGATDTPLSGSIRFTDVRADVGGRLDGVSITVKCGEHVAVIGPSGSGKSTLLRLLTREAKVASGEVAVDGRPIECLSWGSLAKGIAIVGQDTSLFHRSVRDNLVYGRPDASGAEIREALTRANAAEFVAALPEGLDTVMGERGATLSGGERQRIIIARAILKDAPILLLDEPTSALDGENAEEVHQALREAMRGRTVVMVTHDPELAAKMDRVIRIADGRIQQPDAEASQWSAQEPYREH